MRKWSRHPLFFYSASCSKMAQCGGKMVMAAAPRAWLEVVGGEQQRLTAVAVRHYLSFSQPMAEFLELTYQLPRLQRNGMECSKLNLKFTHIKKSNFTRLYPAVTGSLHAHQAHSFKKIQIILKGNSSIFKAGPNI